MRKKDKKKKKHKNNIIRKTIKNASFRFRTIGNLLGSKYEKRRLFLLKVKQLFQSKGPVASNILVTVISFLSVYEMSKASTVCKAFSQASQAAVLTRNHFSDSEYNRIINLKSGVGENLLFQLATSPGIDLTKRISSVLGEHNIFIYACYKGYYKSVINLVHKMKPSFECLYYACLKNNYHIVEALLDDGRVDASADNNFCLRIAASDGNVEILGRLLKVENVEPGDLENYAIKNAIKYGRIECLELLLKDKRVKVDSETLNRVLAIYTNLNEDCIA